MFSCHVYPFYNKWVKTDLKCSTFFPNPTIPFSLNIDSHNGFLCQTKECTMLYYSKTSFVSAISVIVFPTNPKTGESHDQSRYMMQYINVRCHDNIFCIYFVQQMLLWLKLFPLSKFQLQSNTFWAQLVLYCSM